MGVAVVEHLINGFELHNIVSPNHLVKRFLGDDILDVLTRVVVRGIFGIVGIIERQPQASCRSVTELHKDILRIVAHIMAHVVTVGRIV